MMLTREDLAWASDLEIYAFGGKMGCGKNYIAEKVLFPLLTNNGDDGDDRNSGVIVMAFADHLKMHCMALNPSLSYDSIFGNKTAESRRLLQTTGSLLRDTEGKDFFVRTLANWIRTYASRGIRKFIITDIRQKNELDFCNSIGAKTIYIEAPQRHEDKLRNETKEDPLIMSIISSHESESIIESIKGDFSMILENDYEQENSVKSTLQDLIGKGGLEL